MRLLTHNLLMCNRKACTEGFPLRIVVGPSNAAKPPVAAVFNEDEDPTNSGDGGPGPMATERPSVEVQEADFEPAFVRRVLSRVDWPALQKTAESLNLSLPSAFTEADTMDENFLREVKKVILDFHVLEGKLICPSCSREYPITKGIPNMLLTESDM